MTLSSNTKVCTLHTLWGHAAEDETRQQTTGNYETQKDETNLQSSRKV